MNDQYDRGMTWDSDEGISGMHELDARGTSEIGHGVDTAYMEKVYDLTLQDRQVAAGVITLASRDTA